MGNGFRTQHEIILHFTAGNPEYYDKGTGNVLKSKRVTAENRHHQTEKPVDLLTRLIKVVCPPGGVVLDPFGGSGSTAVAAETIGCSAICIERDATHVETANNRVATQVQTGLFT
jgi:site-specific DNA-methyltransferase (adenine-specific)